MSEETKDVAVRDEAAMLALGAEAFKGEGLMDGVEVYLPRIQIIHQGALFEMPDGETVKSFKGTILDMHKANAYWHESYDDGGTGVFPDCYSLDGVTPEGSCDDQQCDTCSKCPKAYFNTEKVEGKPVGVTCRNTKRLHLVIEGTGLPYRLVASVKNMKPVDIYASLLAGAATPYPLVETEFSLKKATSKGGKEYSELVLRKVGLSHLVQTREDVQKVKDMINQWRSVMRDQVVFDN